MAIDELPTEIVYDILLRLDVRELCKYRCVSKSWNFFISDSSFVRSHTLRSMKKIKILLLTRKPVIMSSLMGLMRYNNYGIKAKFPKDFRIISIRPFNQDNFSTRAKASGELGFMLRNHHNPFDMEHSRHKIISCCGGLVLLGLFSQQSTTLCLMNPVNSRINELPIISESDGHGSYYNSRYGLGYSNLMEFKVIRFFHNKDGCGCDVLVLNDSPTWERLHDNDLPTARGDGTLAGGSLFFGTLRTDSVILRFDVQTNKVSLVNYPPCGHNSPGDFIEINGELGISYWSNWKNTHRTKILDIWILKDKENSVWVNTYTIKIRVGRDKYLGKPIYFIDEDTWFIEYSDKVFMCNRSGSYFQEIDTRYKWQCFYWENLSLL